MMWLEMLIIVIFVTIFFSTLFYFTDESCLPYKRKMEKALDTILSYQRKNETCGIEFTYKEKKFNVGVRWDGSVYKYGYYAVYINGTQVMTWHVLSHLFTKSRLAEHHGDMKEYEEHEIIQAAYKHAKKANNEWYDEKFSKSSYFN